jgi:hypothetical protein
LFSDAERVEIMNATIREVAEAAASPELVRQPTLIEFLPNADGQLEGHVKQATSYTVTPDE